MFTDLEHGVGSWLEALHLLQAARAGGASCVLRVADGGAKELKRALDLGPEAVLVPMVDSAAQARAVSERAR